MLEQVWATLVEAIAAGDQLALHALYEMAHRFVFTLVMRITSNRETAEELTIDVFYDVWRRASRYDAANGTVLGWIMNQARSRAIDRLRFENRKKRSHCCDKHPLIEGATDPDEFLSRRRLAHLPSRLLRLRRDDGRLTCRRPVTSNAARGVCSSRTWSPCPCQKPPELVVGQDLAAVLRVLQIVRADVVPHLAHHLAPG
jgi:RNA polymerase sigma factor (sigma-70 family)